MTYVPDLDESFVLDTLRSNGPTAASVLVKLTQFGTAKLHVILGVLEDEGKVLRDRETEYPFRTIFKLKA